MHPARFVSLLLVYAGALFLVQFAFVYRFRIGLESMWLLVVGLVLSVTGLNRLRDASATRPRSYGSFVYVLVGLCLALTAITGVLVLL